MQVSQKCIDLVKRHEVLVTHSYLCPAGVISIGWGHTGSDVTKTDKLTGERFKIKLKGLEARRKSEKELFNL